MKKVLCILLAILAVFALAAAGGYGYAWYRSNHIFVDGQAYSIHATSLDLREEDITMEHYDEVHAQLPNCEILWMVPFQGGSYSSDSQSLSVTTLTQEDVDILLEYFPNLTKLDASGCGEYALLSDFQQQRPQCQVVYQVDLGGVSVELDETELTLEIGDYDYDTLMENLVYLPQVSAITLRTPELSTEQIEQLRAAYEQIDIRCTVALLGVEYDTDTTELDLSALTAEEVAETAEKLAMLPALTAVELVDANGESALSKEDVKTLMAAAPDAVFHYSFDFFGTTVSTDDEEIILTNQSIGDDNEDEVRLALDLLKNCQRLVLDNCKLSNEVLAQIREDYREQTKVVWRVWYGDGSSLTDVEVVRVTYDLDNDNSHDLVYCEDVVYMDIGHNEWLKDISFVSGMPNLEVIIISGSLVEDLTPFESCKKLRILEAAFCEQITDLSPLASCESLEMLNIGNTHVTDLSPLDDLELTHLMARVYPSGVCRISTQEQERFIEVHPDCWSSFSGAQPYGSGWRYDDEDNQLEWYTEAAKQFRYPNSPNNTGWYLITDDE